MHYGKNEFESKELLEVLEGKIISVEHVGSTSVEGLTAPVLWWLGRCSYSLF